MGQDFDKTWILNQFRKHVQKSAMLHKSFIIDMCSICVIIKTTIVFYGA